MHDCVCARACVLVLCVRAYVFTCVRVCVCVWCVVQPCISCEGDGAVLPSHYWSRGGMAGPSLPGKENSRVVLAGWC